jgi:signal transduction histidine kinase
LAVIQLHSHNLTQRIDKQLPDIRASIAAISNSVARMQQDMHDMIHSLRPALLDELGLGDSLRELVAQWQDHNRGTECTLKLEGDLENLGETLNITVYRLVQEGLTNIAKHAQANQAAVRLCRQQMCQRQGDAEKEDCITLTIQDNGKGIDSHLPTNGYGLAGMRERVLAVGGHFSIDDSHEQGVRLVAKLFISHNNICDVGS